MNKCFLIGNLTADPNYSQTSTGVDVTNFTIAVNRRYKKEDGTVDTDFLPIIAWRQLAKLCGDHLTKGKKVAVSGSVQTRSYEAKDGSTRYVTEIVADEIEFLSPKETEAPKKESRYKPTPIEELPIEVDEDLPF